MSIASSFPWLRKLLPLALLGLLAFLVGRHTVSRETPLAPAVVAPVKYVRLGRPVERPSLGQRLHYGAQAPRQAAITPGPTPEGQEAVRRYCQPITTASAAEAALPSRGRDSTVVTAPATLPDFRGKLDGKRLQLWSVESDGAEWTAIYDTPSPHWRFLTHGDSVLLSTERTPWLFGRALGRCASGAGLGAGASLLSGGSQVAVALSAASACALRLVGLP